MPAYRAAPWGGPAAPLVDLAVSWNGKTEPMLAILDTGADQTQISLAIAHALGLRKIRDKKVTGTHGDTKCEPVYAANLAFDGLIFDSFPVVATSLPLALIGRDILNRVAVLDGPRQTFSLTTSPI